MYIISILYVYSIDDLLTIAKQSLRDLKSVKKIAGRYSPNRRKSKKHPPTVCAQFQVNRLSITVNHLTNPLDAVAG